MKARLLEIPVDELLPPERPVREQIDPDRIRELADSLIAQGQLVPIIVRKELNHWRITAGHRRYLAARIAGLKTLKALEKAGSHGDHLMTMVAENCAREEMTPWEEAQVVGELVLREGRDVDQVSRAFGKSRLWVDRRLEMLDWPEDIRRAVHLGAVSLAAALELAHVKDDGYRQYYIASAITGGCTATTARAWRCEWEARGGPTMAAPAAEGEAPTYNPPPAAGLECSSCGTLTRLQDLQTLHVCRACLAPKEKEVTP